MHCEQYAALSAESRWTFLKRDGKSLKGNMLLVHWGTQVRNVL